ncbi:MAG: hypothetical protein O3A80_04025 [bacterium]|nr:hypothetical protein [bacterium]
MGREKYPERREPTPSVEPATDRVLPINPQKIATRRKGKTRSQLIGLSLGISKNNPSEDGQRLSAYQMERLGDAANASRSRDEMQALIRKAFDVQKDATVLDALPELNFDIMYTSGAESQIYIDGKLTVIAGGNERTRMNEIDKRLAKTLTLLEVDNENTTTDRINLAKKFREGSSYVVPFGDTFELARSVIGQDIRWLSSPLRIPIGPDAPKVSKEREAIFRGYRDRLTQIKNTLTTPAAEHAYVTRYGNDDENRRNLEKFCRDPNAVAGAGKFALLLAVGALLALWSIKDIKGGTISFGTLLLAGAAMFLMQSGPKNAFMASDQFGSLVKHIGNDGLEKIDRMKPSARNHLIATLKFYSGSRGGITEKNIKELTNPTTTNGRSIDSKKVPEDIATLFLGYQDTAGAAYVLERSSKVRDPQGQEIKYALAKEYQESGIDPGELREVL